MKRWHVFTSLCLLALWLPALNHCRLEQLPGLGFLACCAHEDTAPHQDNDCETDGCALVENGFFKLEEPAVRPAAPDVSVWLQPPEPAFTTLRPTASIFASDPVTHSPPWQSAFRVIGLPRAPSRPA